MSDELDLSLPRGRKAGRRRSGADRIGVSVPTLLLLAAVLAVSIASLVVVLLPDQRAAAGSDLSTGELEELALRLEQRGLLQPAIETWEAYLARAQMSREDRARVWYRIGTLYQTTGQHERAIEYFY